ncbi:hypothetical protein [Halobacillus sp. A5]|uniref:hypothetical protein n=1 Tax=Halobacillus sp. A5 TaxID=2880263 RepID=UPI0020A62230|nr:hypothetical protein [Halobacillus sp. A5]MCP3025683.1 hypothetical protein [Halobacillus sp. A5]
MKYIWLSICATLVFLMVFYFYTISKEEAVVKYFPTDEDVTFEKAETSLSYQEGEGADEYEIGWEISSKSDQPVYLRQDVSLLYVNGRLKGVINKWQENTDELSKHSTLHGEDTKKYEALSFHHGEIHKDEEVINSIQATTSDQLYIIDSPYTNRMAFKSAKTKEEEDWQNKLDHSIYQQLKAQWDELLAFYQIPESQYEQVPLTDLPEFNEENPFPYTTGDQYSRISGQLWEGLYKNYILGIRDAKSKHPIQSYIPLLLFDKKGKHLMVLFEDDQGEKKQLIQYY